MSSLGLSARLRRSPSPTRRASASPSASSGFRRPSSILFSPTAQRNVLSPRRTYQPVKVKVYQLPASPVSSPRSILATKSSLIQRNPGQNFNPAGRSLSPRSILARSKQRISSLRTNNAGLSPRSSSSGAFYTSSRYPQSAILASPSRRWSTQSTSASGLPRSPGRFGRLSPSRPSILSRSYSFAGSQQSDAQYTSINVDRQTEISQSVRDVNDGGSHVANDELFEVYERKAMLDKGSSTLRVQQLDDPKLVHQRASCPTVSSGRPESPGSPKPFQRLATEVYVRDESMEERILGELHYDATDSVQTMMEKLVSQLPLDIDEFSLLKNGRIPIWDKQMHQLACDFFRTESDYLLIDKTVVNTNPTEVNNTSRDGQSEHLEDTA